MILGLLSHVSMAVAVPVLLGALDWSHSMVIGFGQEVHLSDDGGESWKTNAVRDVITTIRLANG